MRDNWKDLRDTLTAMESEAAERRDAESGDTADYDKWHRIVDDLNAAGHHLQEAQATLAELRETLVTLAAQETQK